MYSNCMIAAIQDFIKNGGDLYVEFYPEVILPHFSVQRKDKVFGFRVIKMFFLNTLWFEGEMHGYNYDYYIKLPCKRIKLFTKENKLIR